MQSSHFPPLEVLVRQRPEDIEAVFDRQPVPESVRMLLAILRREPMRGGSGWFGPAESRFNWEWLARRHGVSPGESISKEQFRGPAKYFDRLDRNRNGRISAADFDWSDSNPWVQQAYQVNRLFRRIDRKGDGRIPQEDWDAFFQRAARGKAYVTSDDLRDAFLGATSAGFMAGDAPTEEMLLEGLLNGELGSRFDGPALGDPAPDFTLTTQDGSKALRLADVIGPRPVVLCFGNYTCGPFRTLYAGIEEIYRHLHAEAEFLAVYVREAHPTDGWVMRSNETVGVSTAQPKSYAERAAVASKCGQLLRTSMPLLVDEIDDPAGNAYSGMPARLYVIDREGKVAYKGGRGPFGFKSGEMEQALIMLLLDGNPESLRTAAKSI